MMKGFRTDRNDGRIYAMGVTAVSGGVYFPSPSKGETCAVILYRKRAKSPKGRIEFPVNAKTGDMWSTTVLGDFSGLEYVYKVDGQQIPDPYGRKFVGMERWGNPTRWDKPVRTSVDTEGGAYDWENDILPCISYDQCVICHTYTRGFTKYVSSGLEGDNRGTFKGVTEKTPYLKNLGITTVEMMSPVEFEKLIIPEHVDGSPFVAEEPDGKLNYWGYTRGYYFAPKRAYSSGLMREPEREFKDTVKVLHRARLELILELFFDGKEAPSYVLDVVRFWTQEYHMDGVRLMGYVPVKLLDEDPYLSRLKLLVPGWDGVELGQEKHLAEYDDGFMMDMRSFLKGGKGRLNRLVYHIYHNPGRVDVVNYTANTNGFTPTDMVSYDTKHNEANGEESRDRTDYNRSWSRGVEGPSRKKWIMQMRRKQICNVLLMPFLSQGTPLLMAGDESGRVKKGNNNSYRQDNDIS